MQSPVDSMLQPISEMASTLSGSEIIRLAGEINAMKKRGEEIHNLTIGDFDPAIFPLPDKLRSEIVNAYDEHHTNYPPADGVPELRTAISQFHSKFQGLDYEPESFLIAGGARPLIYALFRTLVDSSDQVVFPVPSWNNNHYCHMTSANPTLIQTAPEHSFMPRASDFRNLIKEARLINLCSPLNPTGTIFEEDDLKAICEMVVKENQRREGNQKPLYLLYDQIYWTLVYGDHKHVDPVSLIPAMRDYTIYIDGISKAFSATGVRVGWAFGPAHIINSMKSILGHVGAWAPKAEQVATARFLQNHDAVETFLKDFRRRISDRLNGFYKGFKELREQGFPVDAIAPAAAIYLTVNIDCTGMRTEEGTILSDPSETTAFILKKSGIALVPFYAFGAEMSSTWYRLSVGTVQEDQIEIILQKLKRALSALKR